VPLSSRPGVADNVGSQDRRQFALLTGRAVTKRLAAMGIRDHPIAPRSPWQNGHAERLIGSIRRECLDHIVVFVP
jgi:transposase InsO family protein